MHPSLHWFGDWFGADRLESVPERPAPLQRDDPD